MLNIAHIKNIKQLFHGTLPYVISFILYSQGINGFTSSMLGSLYAFFAMYIYIHIKKEEPVIFIVLFIVYFISISGWGDM